MDVTSTSCRFLSLRSDLTSYHTIPFSVTDQVSHPQKQEPSQNYEFGPQSVQKVIVNLTYLFNFLPLMIWQPCVEVYLGTKHVTKLPRASTQVRISHY